MTKVPGPRSRLKVGETVKVLQDIHRLPSNQPDPRKFELYATEGTVGVIEELFADYTSWGPPFRYHAKVRSGDRLLTLRITSLARV